MLSHLPSYPHTSPARGTSGATLYRLWTHTSTRVAAATGAATFSGD